MKIHFFERNPTDNQISIEKLFGILKIEFLKKNVQCVNIINPYSLKMILKTGFYFRKNQGDINHITGDIHWASLFLDSKRTILTIHDLVGLKNLKGVKKRLYFLFWLYLPLKKLKYITVISLKTKKEIAILLPWAEKKIRVIPNCLTVPVEKQLLLSENSKPLILVIGSTKNKNRERLFKAIIGLNVKLIIIGKLTKKLFALLVDNKIDFVNEITVSEFELIDYYKRSDILCFPSLYEGFGLPILEAQAQNCAVITSNKSPMKEVSGGAALLINPKSEEEIKNAITKLVNDTELRKELIQKGKENIKNYSPEIIANKYLDLYKEVLKNN